MGAFTFSRCLPCNLSTKGVMTPFPVSRDKMTYFKGKFHQHRPMVSQQDYFQKITKTFRVPKNEVPIIHAIKNGDSDNGTSLNESGGAYRLLRGIYEFSRPYTTFATIISITSISLLSLKSWAQLTPAFLLEVLKAIASSVLMNIYVVGLNQIYDVELDKVNKPYLPLASGVLSMNFGAGIVIGSLILSLALAIRTQSPPLLAALVTWGALGTLYSVELPFLRWKRSPLLAAMCIIITRSLAIQFGFFIHMQRYVLGQSIALSRAIIYAGYLVFLFTGVVALFKDIPDIDGDELFGFQSFSVRLGKERVFWLCISMLMAAYGGGMAMGFCSTFLVNKIISVLGHFVLGSILMYRTLRVDMDAEGSMRDFYMFICKLFYAEYVLIPFLR